MGIGAGYFAGGMYQGQQDQIANQQRQQLIAIQQAEADHRQTLFSEQQSDSSNAKDASMQNLFASIPDPNAPAPGGQPGQASVPGQTRMPPGAMGGANLQPVPPQSPQAPQPMPPMPPMPPQQGAPQAPQQGGPVRQPPPQAGPAGQQMPQVPGQQPMQPAQQPGPQAGPQQPAGSAGMDDPVKQALAQLDQTKQQLNTPVAQKIASDSGVQRAQQQLHDYVAELRKEGHDPTQPGGSQPDPVQQARLMQLFQGLSVASATAAGYATEDKKEAVKLGESYAKVYISQEHANATLKSAGIRAQGSVDAASIRGAAGGGRSGGGMAPEFETLSDSQKRQVEQQIQSYQTTGKFVSGTGYNDPIKKVALAEMDRRGLSASEAQANKGSIGGAQAGQRIVSQKLAVLEPAYQAFEDNFGVMLTAAQKYGLQGSQPINAIVNAIRAKGGQADAEAFEKAVTTVQTEYGKILTGSTGAAGSSVAALKKAGESINPNMTFDQLKAVEKILKSDGQNVIKGFRDEQKKLDSQIRATGKSSGGGGGADKASSAGAGGFIGADGTEFSDADVSHVMQQTGMTRAQIMEKAGVK